MCVLQPAKRQCYSGDNVFTPVERELIFDIVSFSNKYLLVKFCTSVQTILQLSVGLFFVGYIRL